MLKVRKNRGREAIGRGAAWLTGCQLRQGKNLLDDLPPQDAKFQEWSMALPETKNHRGSSQKSFWDRVR